MLLLGDCFCLFSNSVLLGLLLVLTQRCRLHCTIEGVGSC